MISKTLSTSEKFAALASTAGPLAEFCQALYPLIICHTDDFGRLHGDPFTIKHQCFPASPRSLEEFAEALTCLHNVELIIWYQVTGKRFIQIPRFDDHQVGLHKRTRSTIPRCTANSGKFRESPEQEKGREENLTEGKGSSDSPAASAVLTFPTVGTQGTEWHLTDAQLSEWQTAYPSMDILAEARKALAWLRADRGRLKTAGGMAKFLVNWLNRATNAGGRSAGGGAKTAGNLQALSDFAKSRPA